MSCLASKISSNPAIHVRINVPETDNLRGVVAFLHGYAEHAGRYDALTTQMMKHNVGVIRCDFRGHGLSDGKRGHTNSHDEYCDDFDAVLKYAFTDEASPLKSHASKPLLAVAHSNGCLIFTRWLLHRFGASPYKPKAALLISPFFGLPGGFGRLPLGALRSIAAVLPSMTSTVSAIPPAHLSRDASVGVEYEKDMLTVPKPLSTFIKSAVGSFCDIHAAGVPARLKATGVPIDILLGTDDKVVSVSAVRSFAEAAKAADASVVRFTTSVPRRSLRARHLS